MFQLFGNLQCALIILFIATGSPATQFPVSNSQGCLCSESSQELETDLHHIFEDRHRNKLSVDEQFALEESESPTNEDTPSTTPSYDALHPKCEFYHNSGYLCHGDEINEIYPEDFPHNITSFHLYGSGVETIKSGTFKSLGFINNTIDISYNEELQTIEPGAFNGLTKLHYMIIKGNDAMDYSSFAQEDGSHFFEVFRPLRSLLQLDLSGNRISLSEWNSVLSSNGVVDDKPLLPCVWNLKLGRNPLTVLTSEFFRPLMNGDLYDLYLDDAKLSRIAPGKLIPFL